ncbi:unnamed protein product [Closterium sp. Naga37s-1]|nr:unnamed protein product [Closterium sp. Naga37s-1]
MAEAVAVVRAKRAAEAAAAAHGEAESQFPRSTSLLEEKFDAYEQANLLIFRSKSDGAHSSTRDSGPSDTPDDSFVPTNAELVTRGSRTSLRLPDSAIEGEDPAGDDAQAERIWGGGAGGGDGGGGNASRREGSGNERAGASGTGRSAEDERGLGAASRAYPPKSTRGSCWRPWRGEQERGEGEHTGGTGKGSSRDTQRSGEGDSGENGHAEGGGDALGEGQGGEARGKNVGRGGGAEEGVGTPLMRSLTEDCGRSGVGGGCPRMESGVLHETEMDEMDGEVLQEAFTRVLALQKRVLHYRDLGGFVLLMALFITILYMQADSSRSYDITAAHSVLYPPGMSQDTTNTFSGADDFYQWLNNSIIQTLWADLTCGDGLCNYPLQYPAFGRFGCEADCGTFPNLTAVAVHLSSQLHSQQAAEQSSWNLCMVNPVSLCWYETPQPFPQGEAHVLIPMHIPDGDWVVVLNAPFGGIRGSLHTAPPGTQRMATLGSSSTVELAAWGYCTHAHDDTQQQDGSAMGDADDQAGATGAGDAAGADSCRDTCVRLATCLPEACDRTFTEQEVAGAFVDCARMCIVAPATITHYESISCPMTDMPTIFPNTPCNVSASNSLAHTSRFRRRKAQARYRVHRTHEYGYWPSSASLSQPPRSTSASSRFLAAPEHASASASATASAAASAKSPTGATQQEQRAPETPAAATEASLAATPPAAGAAEASLAPSTPWLLLGATDRQRIIALQVAVSRALYTMAKDRCLAGRAPGSEAKHLEGGAGSVRAGIVASLCTALGGPVATMEECRLRDETGQQMAAVGEMYSYLHRTHVSGGRVISAQHMRRFVQTVVAALRSVTGLDEAACARISTLLHGFDDAIVTSDALGCSQGRAWLQWRVGVKHNTTIHVGDKVTWVWDDNLPHSLRVAGMGEAADPLFLGFGGHRLAVSRQLACTPMNVGAGDISDDPLPCVLSEWRRAVGWGVVSVV